MPSTPSSIPPASLVGRMAGEYRLRRKLGEGGFGAVYEAEHPVLKRRAAVKVLHRAAGRDSDAVLRFVSEAQAANQIRTRHIVDIFSFGTLPDGRHFYVMDMLDGEPLDRYLERECRLTVADALQLLQPIVEALDAAHSVGIVHRDLKPQNIYLSWEPNGETVPKLLDFGLAKLMDQSPVHTASGTPMGTPLYMSPEQALGSKVDGRADVYGLGVLCYQMLTGQLPITGDSTVAVLMAHITQAAPRMSDAGTDLATVLDAPISRMLEKEPSARPATPGAALAELRRAAEQAGYEIPPGMPHLPPPPRGANQADAPESGDDDLAAARTVDAAGSGNPEFEREAMVQSSRPKGASSVNWPFLSVLAVLAAVATYLVAREMKAPVESKAVVASSAPRPLPEAAAAPESVAIPSAKPATPVAVRIDGAPPGARILLDGVVLGEAPGPISLPFGDTPVKLTISAPGYDSAEISATPNQALEIAVKMKKRESVAPRKSPIPRDLESPF